MKQLLLIFILSCIISPVFASKIIIEDTSSAVISKSNSIVIPNNVTIKQLLGRKLTLKEKLALLYARTTYKKGIPLDTIEAKKANSSAIIGFIFSLLGIFIFPLFAIPAYVLCDNMLRKEKKQPGILTPTSKTLAQIGKITAIVTGVLIVLVILLIFLLLASLAR